MYRYFRGRATAARPVRARGLPGRLTQVRFTQPLSAATLLQRLESAACPVHTRPRPAGLGRYAPTLAPPTRTSQPLPTTALKQPTPSTSKCVRTSTVSTGRSELNPCYCCCYAWQPARTIACLLDFTLRVVVLQPRGRRFATTKKRGWACSSRTAGSSAPALTSTLAAQPASGRPPTTRSRR
jgi:hypothetical protein